MLTAMTAVDNIVNGISTKENIWQINTEVEYHEEKKGEPEMTNSPAPPPCATALSRHEPNLPRAWVRAFQVLSALLILFDAWEGRYFINSDGISYLDMARYLMRGDFAVLLHPYWSPAYPALLAIALKAFSTTQLPEIVIVHLVNALIGLGALLAFSFFIHEWYRFSAARVNSEPPDLRSRVALAYALFVLGTLQMIGIRIVSPDLLIAALVFVEAGLAFRLASKHGKYTDAACLGVVLAASYFVKTPMLPLGLILLVLLALPAPGAATRPRHIILTALIFLALTMPFVAMLSQREHKLTFGESGRLNYAWLVLRTVPIHAGWVDATREAGIPTHPVRVLMPNPTIYEFANTTPGTLPLWYDPTYFHQGLRVRFDAKKQLMRLLQVPAELGWLFVLFALPLVAGFGVLVVSAGRQLSSLHFAAPWMVVWSILAVLLYALVVIESRYIGAFVAIFCVLVFELINSIEIPKVEGLKRGVSFATALILVLLFLVCDLAYLHAAPSTENDGLTHLAVARELGGLGLHPGDEIAVLGNPFDVYYAHVAQFRVVAVIGDEVESDDNVQYSTHRFWDLREKDLSSLRLLLARHGIKAIVTSDRCAYAIDNGWLPLDTNQFCAMLI